MMKGSEHKKNCYSTTMMTVKKENNNMILNMDTIQFESRAEIGTIIKALEEWQESHKADNTVQELIDKLDAMSMSW